MAKTLSIFLLSILIIALGCAPKEPAKNKITRSVSQKQQIPTNNDSIIINGKWKLISRTTNSDTLYYLYDLSIDERETKNLAKSYPEVIAMLKASTKK